LPGYSFFLNLGGIANISAHGAAGPATPATPSGTATPSTPAATATPATPADGFVAFDVCPANRVLNELAAEEGLAYDKDGALAAGGHVDAALLQQLNALPYYGQGYPKSLGNEFGLETVLPLVRGAGLSVADGLRTYVEHLVAQIGRAIEVLGFSRPGAGAPVRMLVTGGGAHNGFLVARLQERMAALGAEVVVPEQALVDYKEALVMALIGVLRWREENNVLASVTGASRDSIGGAVWIGQEA
jgi:anhydro-N-acetylmuramic acid kinase